MSSRPAAELIAAVERSPALVAVHDRAGWCGLFAAAGEVNDPVGSTPHVGRAAIEHFYDTFIAPNGIAFNVEHDAVGGMSVMRDLTIRTTMATGLVLNVPMHLRYDLVEEDGALRIRRLHAHWELPFMIGALLRTGLKGLWTSLVMTGRMLRHLGLGGMLGFMRGFFGKGRRGKRTAEAFLQAAARADVAAATALLAPGATLEMPFGTSVATATLMDALRGIEWRKLIGAGDFVTATVQFGGGRGVAVFHFPHGTRRIGSLQIFA